MAFVCVDISFCKIDLEVFTCFHHFILSLISYIKFEQSMLQQVIFQQRKPKHFEKSLFKMFGLCVASEFFL